MSGIADGRPKHALDQQRLTIRGICLPAVPQDRDTAFIVPIVNDALGDASVSTPRHRTEEIPCGQNIHRGRFGS
jgi:hypothetical protein